MWLISQPAPDFSLPAITANAAEPRQVTAEDYRGHWLLLLFYPRDFSFVCPTELTSFSAHAADFQKRQCQILGISVDSIETHRAWLQTPVSAGGLGPLQFPLAADTDGQLAARYGIWLPDKQVSARGLFLIDPQGAVQYGVVHNLSVGRSVDEILRVLDALQNGGLCPASWTAADGTIDPERALQPGRVLGHYRIRRLLGQGTFGSVFAAWDLRLEREVALKVLQRKAADSLAAVLHEARAAAALNHPHVCTIYAVEEIDGLPVIVLEFVDGRALTSVLAESPDESVRLRIARGIASGLAAAHARRIVHGDLKPGNVLVDRDLQPRILDFGLARRPSSTESNRKHATGPGMARESLSGTSADPAETVIVRDGEFAAGDVPVGNLVCGTPAYMAPEQWQGVMATPACDVFAFGLLFYELFSGQRALAGSQPMQIMQQVRARDLASGLLAQIPDRFRSLLSRLLAGDPAARPSMDVVEQELRSAGAE
ncbi:MAG: redoxin domain-containing protein [Planctomycetes bacterium]|nr:redoxin domain-containing protein [Planctomycetota bacterium]